MTKVRITALIVSGFMVGLSAASLGWLFAVRDGIDLSDPSVGVILVTGLIGILAASVGYLGGALSRLTDDSGPPPWVGLLEEAIRKI